MVSQHLVSLNVKSLRTKALGCIYGNLLVSIIKDLPKESRFWSLIHFAFK